MNQHEITNRPTLVPKDSPVDFGEAGHFWTRLHGYLQTTIDVHDQELKELRDEARDRRLIKLVVPVVITTTNIAPQAAEGPRIVFAGVTLEIVPLRTKDSSEPAWAATLQRTGPAPDLDGERGEPAPITAPGPEGGTVALQQGGDALYPGQSITYELWVTPADLPFFEYQVRGSISMRHLFSYDRVMSVPAPVKRPAALEALQKFNALELHEPFTMLVKRMPKFNENTRFSDVEPFRPVLEENTPAVDALLKDMIRLHRAAPNPQIARHIQGVRFYLDELKAACGRMSEALGSGKLMDIRRAVQDFEFVRVIANEVNSGTERLMESHEISDKECAYRYRN